MQNLTYNYVIPGPNGNTIKSVKAFWQSADNKWHFSPEIRNQLEMLKSLRGKRLPDGTTEFYTDNATYHGDTIEEVIRQIPQPTIPEPKSSGALVSDVETVFAMEGLSITKQRVNKIFEAYGLDFRLGLMRKRRYRGYEIHLTNADMSPFTWPNGNQSYFYFYGINANNLYEFVEQVIKRICQGSNIETIYVAKQQQIDEWVRKFWKISNQDRMYLAYMIGSSVITMKGLRVEYLSGNSGPLLLDSKSVIVNNPNINSRRTEFNSFYSNYQNQAKSWFDQLKSQIPVIDLFAAPSQGV